MPEPQGLRDATRGDDDGDDSRPKKKGGLGRGLQAFGMELNRSSVDQLRDVASNEMQSMRKGGTVRRGKHVRLHKGERAVRARGKRKGRAKAGRA